MQAIKEYVRFAPLPDSVLESPHCFVKMEALLTYKDAMFERLADHFNNVLNRPTGVGDNNIDRVQCSVSTPF